MSCVADVVIVGGGPAGAAAAIWSALGGLRVTMLERSAFPRHRPGETLHPGVQSIFCQLGVEQLVASGSTIRHSAQHVAWGSRNLVTGFGADAEEPWLGYQILRETLDSILIERAREVGVDVVQPVAGCAAIVDNNRVVGVRSFKTILGRFVVDATGGRSWLHRQLGLKVKAASPPLRAYYGYCEGALEESHVLPSLTADDGGWTWIAQIGPAQFHWTRMDFSCESRVPHRPQILAPLRPKSRTRGADVTWRLVQPSAGGGFFIIGDAAVVLDPAASHGVLRALMSGMMAAHAIRQVMAGAVNESFAAQQYCDWLSEWFEHDQAQLTRLYRELNPVPAWLARRTF